MRQPVAVIDMGKGLQAFDSHGVLFGRFASRPPELPMVEAKEGTEKVALSEAAKVIRALPADLAAQIDYVRVGSVDEITLVLGNGRSVLWGVPLIPSKRQRSWRSCSNSPEIVLM